MDVDPAAPPVPPTSPLSAPPSAAAKPAPKPKPKSARAPSPPPPPPPPPPQTIRLEIRLGGPDNYEVDVKTTARDAGFVWGDLLAKKHFDDASSGSESEGDDDAAKEAPPEDGKPKSTAAAKKKTKSKTKAAAEYYDVSDPFIDDSELAIDERTYFAQTKQKGFYVSSGEVALVRDRSPKKPKSKKKNPALSLSLSIPLASTSALPGKAAAKPASTAGPKSKAAPRKSSSVAKETALGTKDSPIPLSDEEDAPTDVAHAVALGYGLNGHEFHGDKGKGRERVYPVVLADPSNIYTAYTNGDLPTLDLEYALKTGMAVMADNPKKRKRENTTVSLNGSAGVTTKSVSGGSEGAGEGAGGKKRKTVDVSSFHPDLQVSIEKLKELIAKESWATKSKFPPSLKPPLAALALQAVALDEYDDAFFGLMPTIFPYNKFTMTKLIKRTIFHDHTALLNQRQDALMEQLAALAKEGFPRAQEEWERSLLNYEEKRKEKDPSVEGSTRATTEDPDGDASKDTSAAPPGTQDAKDGPGKGGAHPGPPLKKYRMTEQMKALVWQLVLLSNECCRLENEKNGLEGSVLQVSEQGLRKVLYQRIVAAFPEGWMSSGQISRDVSAMKKKYEKEVVEADDF
ncbi:hypothetical protein C8J57DRAFT_1186419 [Mycena rebaudengoi]|nr:hypothetical protein C8J57DRAFT_1186419 [Mycena rebaudengoi]